LVENDSALAITTNLETDHTIIAWMSQLHHNIIRDRLFGELMVEVDGRRTKSYQGTQQTTTRESRRHKKANQVQSSME
jgi:translation elongation factor EF-G